MCDRIETNYGYADYRLAPGRTCEIVDIAVATEHRQLGRGRQLVQQVVNNCREHAAVLYAFTRAENEPAQRFYQKLGFQAHPIPGFYIGDGHDAVLYTLTIQGS